MAKHLSELIAGEHQAVKDYGEKASQVDPQSARVLRHIQGEEKHHARELTELQKEKSMAGKKSKKKKGGKKIRVMHIRRAKTGGFIAQHDHEPDTNGQPVPSDEHVMPDMEALKDHVAEHMGGDDEGAEEAQEGEGVSGAAPSGAESQA